MSVATPFTYSDVRRQERNQAGHDAENLYLGGRTEEELNMEFKFDRRQAETGNWYVEAYDNKGEDSGIRATPYENWYSQSPNGKQLRVKTKILRKFIREQKPPLWDGDEGSKGYVFTDEWFQGWLRKNEDGDDSSSR